MPDTSRDKMTSVIRSARLSVAPMMQWTDRHCRVFHRLMSQHSLLYTEMVTAPALVRGGARHLLEFYPAEHPVAVQLGGSDAAELAEATRMCCDEGYDEVNLNVGCPSDRVQSGAFGAILMTQPDLVADCVSAMRAASSVEVTVKCRIGVDDQIPEDVLPQFLQKMQDAGVTRLTIHARKAWLKGLSPKENRDIPPLDYPLVYAMKQAFPDLHLSINGGISTEAAVKEHLQHMDGVMVGRAAYHQPYDILGNADAVIFGDTRQPLSRVEVVMAMQDHIERHVAAGGKLSQITKHMLGLFAGLPGARNWRRILSDGAHQEGAGFDVVRDALLAVDAR
ncbi:tRNA-U16,U17-dihydrouridine synthase [Pacificibacter maritimus]|uniref:tRNA-dihydrouridine(20/20a) synthase n=1 Tax=Pacificibacter maritimus TaxID=762213 RepID=A0A3N4V3H3_9RHOB|nr:tRNA dihydrouridine(20/20a) synthase DusA [Pacificibacter maritimus]RPE71657.1 tRNA-U16,U17-dihydrouridine synthase [Pacificibacter maritimus]